MDSIKPKTMDGPGGMPPVVILARMSSRRLPGKALRELGARTVLESVVDGACQALLPSAVFVLTSSERSDDPIADWGNSHGVSVMRGALDNVGERVLRCAEQIAAPAVVRISGDSPFIDPRLIDRAVDTWMSESVDLVTNIFPRGFPKGQSVEVISTAALGKLMAGDSLSQADLEHVTPGFYRTSAAWAITNVGPSPSEIAEFHPVDLTSVQLSVDTKQDLDRARMLAGPLLGQVGMRPSWLNVTRAYVDRFVVNGAVRE